MEYIVSLPAFGIVLTLLCYGIGVGLHRLVPCPLTHPMAIADALVIALVRFTPLTAEQYFHGGGVLILFIVPATVVLALRIYRQWPTLHANALPVVVGCTAGSLASIGSVWLLCHLCHIDEALTVSLLPKSVTTAIATELAAKHGGISGLAIAAVVVTGVSGAACAPFFIRLFRLKDPVATGVAMGASGHAVGTAAAIALGDVEGAMAGIALGLEGLITTLIFVLLF